MRAKYCIRESETFRAVPILNAEKRSALSVPAKDPRFPGRQQLLVCREIG